jgi:methyl-accepting chemotaxis protein
MLASHLRNCYNQVSIAKNRVNSMRTIRWTVGRKLLAGFGVVAVLIAIMAGIGFITTMAIRERFNKVAEDTIIEVEALDKIQASALELQTERYAYVLFGAAEDLEETEETLQELDQAVEVHAAAGENGASAEEVSASTEEMTAQVEEVVASAEELSALAEELHSAVAQFRLDGPGRVEFHQQT